MFLSELSGTFLSFRAFFAECRMFFLDPRVLFSNFWCFFLGSRSVFSELYRGFNRLSRFFLEFHAIFLFFRTTFPCVLRYISILSSQFFLTFSLFSRVSHPGSCRSPPSSERRPVSFLHLNLSFLRFLWRF